MDMKDIALNMWPAWMLGIAMLYATWRSKYKELLRIDWKAVRNWTIFLVLLTLWRMWTINRLDIQALEGAAMIPWQSTLTVFWEDACHGMPLVLLRKYLGTKWFTWPIHILALLIVMIAFGAGHVYQGIGAAIVLSFYIPLSMDIGKKNGFGTVMIGHVLYDLFTVLCIAWALRGN